MELNTNKKGYNKLNFGGDIKYIQSLDMEQILSEYTNETGDLLNVLHFDSFKNKFKNLKILLN